MAQDIEMQMVDLNIDNEENEELILDEGVEEGFNRFELCLVGSFLTENNINSRVIKTKMADIWRPIMGITIKNLKLGVFLFQFYHADDMKWVLNGGPWLFDNALLVLSVIKEGEDPTKVLLLFVDFWIQIYDLPVGYMSETVGKSLGKFFGTFIQYDSHNNSSIWREFMRLKIHVDIRRPLKCKKKIVKKDKTEVVVNCKYERLGDFCFICGMLSHTERFCKKKFESESTMIQKEWGSWLRAPPCRGNAGGRSRWLREENDGEWRSSDGQDKINPQFSSDIIPRKMQSGDLVVKEGDNLDGHALKSTQAVTAGQTFKI